MTNQGNPLKYVQAIEEFVQLFVRLNMEIIDLLDRRSSVEFKIFKYSQDLFIRY